MVSFKYWFSMAQGTLLNTCYKKWAHVLIEWRTTTLSNPQYLLWSCLQVGWLLPGLPGTVLIYSCCPGRIIKYVPFIVWRPCLDNKLYHHMFLEAFLLFTIVITLFPFSAAFSVSTQPLTKSARSLHYWTFHSLNLPVFSFTHPW